jgi:hypothetical protein
LEGDAPRAERHLTLAEPNGQAALRLTKEHKCRVDASAGSTTSGRRRSSLSTLFCLRADPRASTSSLFGSHEQARTSLSSSRAQARASIAAAQRGVTHAKR